MVYIPSTGVKTTPLLLTIISELSCEVANVTVKAKLSKESTGDVYPATGVKVIPVNVGKVTV
jgi:hypothetical protein